MQLRVQIFAGVLGVHDEHPHVQDSVVRVAQTNIGESNQYAPSHKRVPVLINGVQSGREGHYALSA